MMKFMWRKFSLIPVEDNNKGFGQLPWFHLKYACNCLLREEEFMVPAACVLMRSCPVLRSFCSPSYTFHQGPEG